MKLAKRRFTIFWPMSLPTSNFMGTLLRKYGFGKRPNVRRSK